MKILQLAARNLWRNTRRTAITLLALVFGLMFVHFTVVLQTGSYRDMINAGIGSLAGHVVVQAEGYQEERDSDVVLHGADDVARRLGERFPEATIAPRMFLGGLLTSPTGSVGAGLTGVDPAAEAAVQDIDEKVVEGTFLDDDDRGILVGVKMAESLGVEVGDKVVWMGQYGDNPEVTSRLFRVKGIFRTGAAELDGFVAMVPLAATRDLYGAGDIAHQVTVHLGDPSRSREATDQAIATLAGTDGLEILSWTEALPEMAAMIELDRTSGDVMLIILLVIVAMGVLNTVLMSALERTREFGVMLAIGMKPRTLASVILLEGLVLGVVGSMAGLGVGILVGWPLVEYGLDYSSMIGSDTMETGGIAISALVKGQYDPWRMGLYTAAAAVMTMLAALYPAVHVARLEPVDAMHHV